MAPQGTIYLLYFDQPLAHAQHYVGFAENLEARLEQHRKGNGARLSAAFAEKGIGFTVARTWPGDRSEERRFKNMKMAPRMCPICREIKRLKGKEA
ncbi:MAG: endonuclease [Thermodesulfobacteriota bacterium]